MAAAAVCDEPLDGTTSPESRVFPWRPTWWPHVCNHSRFPLSTAWLFAILWPAAAWPPNRPDPVCRPYFPACLPHQTVFKICCIMHIPSHWCNILH